MKLSSNIIIAIFILISLLSCNPISFKNPNAQMLLGEKSKLYYGISNPHGIIYNDYVGYKVGSPHSLAPYSINHVFLSYGKKWKWNSCSWKNFFRISLAGLSGPSCSPPGKISARKKIPWIFEVESLNPDVVKIINANESVYASNIKIQSLKPGKAKIKIRYLKSKDSSYIHSDILKFTNQPVKKMFLALKCKGNIRTSNYSALINLAQIERKADLSKVRDIVGLTPGGVEIYLKRYGENQELLLGKDVDFIEFKPKTEIKNKNFRSDTYSFKISKNVKNLKILNKRGGISHYNIPVFKESEINPELLVKIQRLATKDKYLNANDKLKIALSDKEKNMKLSFALIPKAKGRFICNAPISFLQNYDQTEIKLDKNSVCKVKKPISKFQNTYLASSKEGLCKGVVISKSKDRLPFSINFIKKN